MSRRVIAWLCCAVLSTCLASAQSFSVDPNGSPGESQIPLSPGPTTITQSTDTTTITALNSVACPIDDDNFARRFDLDGDHSIVGQFDVSSVDFAVESGTIGASLTVNLYSIAASDPLLVANLTLIGTATISATTAGPGFETVAVAGSIADPTTTDLYVEIFVPDSTQAFVFFPGSNANGQIAPNYLRSAGCGADEPTATGDLGFPDMHLVMLVDGTENQIPVTLQSVEIE